MSTPNIATVLCAVAIVILTTCQAFAVTVYSRSDGTWSFTAGGGNCGCTPQQNNDIFVNHNITIAGPFTVNTGSLTVSAGVTLTIDGNLTFNNGSTVLITGSLYVKGDFENKNNSNDIDFNGTVRI